MTSLQTRIKQIPANDGYYVTIGDARTRFYVNTGTDELPNISTNIYAVSTSASTLIASAGAGVFRDMGKTLISSSRVFRKVQLMTSTGSVLTTGTAGVGGVDSAPFNYITGYIELPGLGVVGNVGAGFTPVARLG